MTAKKQLLGDDVEGWASIADALCRLKMATDYAAEFSEIYGKYMSTDDRVEMAGMNTKFNTIYYKYWEKLVKKIRGI